MRPDPNIKTYPFTKFITILHRYKLKNEDNTHTKNTTDVKGNLKNQKQQKTKTSKHFSINVYSLQILLQLFKTY